MSQCITTQVYSVFSNRVCQSIFVRQPRAMAITCYIWVASWATLLNSSQDSISPLPLDFTFNNFRLLGRTFSTHAPCLSLKLFILIILSYDFSSISFYRDFSCILGFYLSFPLTQILPQALLPQVPTSTSLSFVMSSPLLKVLFWPTPQLLWLLSGFLPFISTPIKL